MKYKDLARTFEIIAAKNPDNIAMDYAEHDEYGFDLHHLKEPLTAEEVRELASLGWSLGRLWELYWSNKVVSDCLFGCGKYMNPYAKMIAMIESDIEDGTFNKDYLDK